MRYENWDVLAFPVGHIPCAPLPEYSTKCAAIRDNKLRAAALEGGQLCRHSDSPGYFADGSQPEPHRY